MESSSSNDKIIAETRQGTLSARTTISSRSPKLALRLAQQNSKIGPGKQEIAISRWLKFIKIEKQLQVHMMEHRRRFLLHEMAKDDEIIRKFFKANGKLSIVTWLKKLQSDKRHIQTSMDKEYRKLQVVETELKNLLRIRQNSRIEKGTSKVDHKKGSSEVS